MLHKGLYEDRGLNCTARFVQRHLHVQMAVRSPMTTSMLRVGSISGLRRCARSRCGGRGSSSTWSGPWNRNGEIHSGCRLPRRLWQAHRRRNQEVGEGDPGGQHQTGIILARADVRAFAMHQSPVAKRRFGSIATDSARAMLQRDAAVPQKPDMNSKPLPGPQVLGI